jgi:phosphatidylglycerol:prolipoprotein diacylglycerol transferase
MIFHLYGLLVGIGIVAGWSVAEKIEPQVNKVFPWVLGFGLVGARLYHVIDQWGYYSQHIPQILAVWNGGLGIFGGVIGGVVGLLFYQQINKLTVGEIWKISGAIVTGLPLAQAIGRWGNLVNNELWGKGHTPLFLYESGLDLGLFILLTRLAKRQWGSGKKMVGAYLLGYGAIRYFLEFWRVDPWLIDYWIASTFAIAGLILLE